MEHLYRFVKASDKKPLPNIDLIVKHKGEIRMGVYNGGGAFHFKGSLILSSPEIEWLEPVLHPLDSAIENNEIDDDLPEEWQHPLDSKGEETGSEFYCQRDIEGNSICKIQCDHCKAYYKPLEVFDWEKEYDTYFAVPGH